MQTRFIASATLSFPKCARFVLSFLSHLFPCILCPCFLDSSVVSLLAEFAPLIYIFLYVCIFATSLPVLLLFTHWLFAICLLAFVHSWVKISLLFTCLLSFVITFCFFWALLSPYLGFVIVNILAISLLTFLPFQLCAFVQFLCLISSLLFGANACDLLNYFCVLLVCFLYFSYLLTCFLGHKHFCRFLSSFLSCSHSHNQLPCILGLCTVWICALCFLSFFLVNCQHAFLILLSCNPAGLLD